MAKQSVEEERILESLLQSLTRVRDGFQVAHDRGLRLPGHGKILVRRKLQEIYDLAEDVCALPLKGEMK